MTEYASMSARQLRKIAPSLGVTGASRMTKEQIIAALPSPRFDRAARDALKRRPVVIWDAYTESLEPDGPGNQTREHRRKFVLKYRTTAGFVGISKRMIPKAHRPRGTARPATRLDLIRARVALGVAR